LLKLAIIRVNDKTGEQEILLEVPLREHLSEAARASARLGFRKRAAKKHVAVYDAAEQRLRDLTLTLP
jgi:hypothetical protein